jgi:hypothetical protein
MTASSRDGRVEGAPSGFDSEEGTTMNIRSLVSPLAAAAVAFVTLFGAAAASAQGAATGYEVTITNLTAGETFTRPVVIIHGKSIGVFELGQPASAELTSLAEAGDTQPLATAVGALPQVDAVTTGQDTVGPGESTTVTVNAANGFERLTVAAMLIPTNDGFYALNGVRLPDTAGDTVTYYATAYDAGTEPNDELCTHIPGPPCNGEGLSEGTDGEGFIHVHPGIHGVGDLNAAVRDWRDPVAEIRVHAIAAQPPLQ